MICKKRYKKGALMRTFFVFSPISGRNAGKEKISKNFALCKFTKKRFCAMIGKIKEKKSDKRKLQPLQECVWNIFSPSGS